MVFTNSTIQSPNELSSRETGRSILLFEFAIDPGTKPSLVRNQGAPFLRLFACQRVKSRFIASQFDSKNGSHLTTADSERLHWGRHRFKFRGREHPRHNYIPEKQRRKRVQSNHEYQK
jgi:hypothetical protein